jgi:hypothetical protein
MPQHLIFGLTKTGFCSLGAKSHGSVAPTTSYFAITCPPKSRENKLKMPHTCQVGFTTAKICRPIRMRRSDRISIFAVDRLGFTVVGLVLRISFVMTRPRFAFANSPTSTRAFKSAITNRTFASHENASPSPTHLVSLGQSLLSLPRRTFYFYSPSLPSHSARRQRAANLPSELTRETSTEFSFNAI